MKVESKETKWCQKLERGEKAHKKVFVRNIEIGS